MNFNLVLSGLDVSQLLNEVESQPFLWNKNPCRLSKRGPHHETQDMFLRYKDESKERESNNWQTFPQEHVAIWNKTIDYLPAAKTIVMDIMSNLKGEVLGGVFLYKVQPGKQIYPHIDRGWHAEFYDKFNICVQSNSQTAFYFDDEAMRCNAGDVHWFRNDVMHWVKNDGDCDHIILTACIRFDKGERAQWSPENWSFDKSLESLCQSDG